MESITYTKRIYLTLLCAVALCGVPAVATAAITLSADFNTGTLAQGVFTTAGLCNQPNDGSLSSEYSLDGGNSFRAQTRKTDVLCGGSFRSEMHVSMYRPEMQSAEWFGFDVYVPEVQPDDDRPEGFVQYQTATATGAPPIGLWYENGEYKLVRQFKLDGVTSTIVTTPIPGSYAKGQWHRWVIRYKRSLGSDGLVEVWVNGEKQVSITGGNANRYNGELEPTGYFKFGIYKWINTGVNASLQESRVVYIDNIRLGDATSGIGDFESTTTEPDPETDTDPEDEPVVEEPVTPRRRGGGGGGGGSTTSPVQYTQPQTAQGCLPGYIFSTLTGKRCDGATSMQATTNVSVYDFGPTTLRVGSRGEGVKELQRFLNRYLGLGLVIDGVLGPKTIAVVREWQRSQALVPDGLIGPKTKALMNTIAARQ